MYLSLNVLELTSNVLASTAVVNHPHSDNSWVKHLTLDILLATIHFHLPPCHPGHNTIDIDSNRLAINSCKLRKINISVLQNSFTFKSYLICWKTSQSGESGIIIMAGVICLYRYFVIFLLVLICFPTAKSFLQRIFTPKKFFGPSAQKILHFFLKTRANPTFFT